MGRFRRCVIIDYIAVLALLIAPSLLAISEKDADKFVNEYESMSQRFLGFFNCISKALTGSEVISAQDPKLNQKIQGVEMERPALSVCFSRMGLKLGPGFAKLTDLFSRGSGKPQDPHDPGAKEGGGTPIDPATIQEKIAQSPFETGPDSARKTGAQPQRRVTKELPGFKRQDNSDAQSDVTPTKPRW